MTHIDFNIVANAVMPYTMTERETILDLCDRVYYIIFNAIPGDFVECGVWKGGSSMAVALTLKSLGVTDRHLYLFDTYSGMTAPEDIDIDRDGTQNCSRCEASIGEVTRNMNSTGYGGLIDYVIGDVNEVLPKCTEPKTIALLRLDTDWYLSTRVELQTLYPKLSQGGVLIVDDYGHWQGSKKATDEYLKLATNPNIKIDRVGYSVLVVTKGEKDAST